MQHVVILPWFCDEEVRRYLKIVRRMAEFPRQRCNWSFLLAASPRTPHSPELFDACSRVAPTVAFQCPTQVFGYPAGPTAMFWDCMEYLATQSPDDGGFGLWLESDMAPVKPDWLDRLDAEWREEPSPWMMGCYVPKVYKKRILRRRKLLLDEHINGGACYSKRFARCMPSASRNGVFDVVAYQYARRSGRVRCTGLIDFSNLARVRRDVVDPNKVLLHGFLQDKDRFIDACTAPVSSLELRAACLNPLLDRVENVCRSLRVMVVRRGHQAMYENMLLAKRKDNGARRAA